MKADFPALDVIINGGLTAVDVALAQLDEVDGVMLGRVAYTDPWRVAELDRAVFGAEGARTRAAVLEAFFDYVAAELAVGTPLRAMTRHLLGLFAGEHGGRRWRRELGQLPDGAAGLAALRRSSRVVTNLRAHASRSGTPSRTHASRSAERARTVCHDARRSCREPRDLVRMTVPCLQLHSRGNPS